jgi:hypothetical protein
MRLINRGSGLLLMAFGTAVLIHVVRGGVSLSGI